MSRPGNSIAQSRKVNYRWMVEALTPEGWQEIYNASTVKQGVRDARKWYDDVHQQVRIVPGGKAGKLPKPRSKRCIVVHGGDGWDAEAWLSGNSSPYRPHGREKYLGVILLRGMPYDVWQAYEGRRSDPSAGGPDELFIAQSRKVK